MSTVEVAILINTFDQCRHKWSKSLEDRKSQFSSKNWGSDHEIFVMTEDVIVNPTHTRNVLVDSSTIHEKNQYNSK